MPRKALHSGQKHMITLMAYFVTDAMDNEVNLDQNTKIEMVFKSLSKDFAGLYFVTCNLGNKNLTLIQLMKELQSYELMLIGARNGTSRQIAKNGRITWPVKAKVWLGPSSSSLFTQQVL
ncbi:hypothetical protein J1N35_014741 [Gossypium stocksii]|uniref:Uncharacterized protein n=1 Tax=Gossypium stocksii TaxID=47602 RepID=A0A9D4A983_9ROSI|nr:hypothetical protein J1N35_014741 [Gossypium stocksii]